MRRSRHLASASVSLRASAIGYRPPSPHAGLQFGLRLDDLGKAFCQHLGNALVTLLTGALQQRPVCGLLEEGMFEEIACLRRTPPLVEQFSVHELRQPPMQALTQSSYRLHDPQLSWDRPWPVVLMGLGVAKIDEQSITQILDDMPLKVLNHSGTDSLIGLPRC